ncbi:poly(U)-specific endoribonuclease homolog isoform X2 [Hyposmocoma kahamanoa]|uniref:poly(U)-specific endoribonuclease homolog isoform X2 n=1 Tax=Hyposmocoma kahamanoa TaxID=1477025 RepID=UPI000E6D6C28|nr:poly(U)-specific endoribonuclease homolog isoform X2 [Hyposmocoma kahamanoa]
MNFATVLLLSVTLCHGQDFAATAGQFLQSMLPTLITNQINHQTQGQPGTNIFVQTDTNAEREEIKNYEELLRQIQDQTSDDDILRLSDEIFNADTNSVYDTIQINLQGKTTPASKNDEAPFNLLYVPAQIWNAPTIKPFVDIFHNYHKNIIVPEFFTENEESEQMTYINTILTTGPIRSLMAYLVDKGLNHLSEYKEQGGLLKKIWFTKYARHWTGFCKCSSPFENIFLAEFNGDEVLGLRSWLFFAMREQYGKANYLGYIDMLHLHDLLQFRSNKANN